MISKKLWIILMLGLLALSLSAQDSTSVITKTRKKNNISWAPSALVNIYPGIQLGYERILDNNQKFEIELAYLRRFGEEEIVDPGNGYRAKLSWKIPSGWTNVDLQINYFHRSYRQSLMLEYSRFDNAFLQIIETDRVTTLNGFAAGITSTENYGAIEIESGISAGPGRLKVENKNVPEDARAANFGFITIFEDNGSYFFPILSFQVKVKYSF